MADLMDAIHLPPATAARVAELVRQRNEMTALIEATVLATREALGVPDDWQIRNVTEGFVAPASGVKVDPEANGVPEGLREPVG